VKRRIPGLSQAALPITDVPDGLYLVRVERIQYRWDKQKPFYAVRLEVVEPQRLAGTSLPGRLWCTEKALWKLSWFLRDFLYDPELLGREEIDEKALYGPRGIVKISHTTVNGTSLLNFDGFAPASQWEELSFAASPKKANPEVA